MNIRRMRGRAVGTAFTAVALMLVAPRAEALPRYGPFEVSGNISAQQLIRNSDVDKYSLVQQRNTIKVRLDYSLLEDGKLIDRFQIPFLERAKAFLLYRGVYDSVYDSTPGFEQNDIYGVPTQLRLSDLPRGERNDIKFQNQLREAYIDLAFKTVPLSLRLGRQQIVWGETDNFRMLDRVNSLDLTWHLQQESWDELRIPYWMIKGLVDLDRLGGITALSNKFLEFYWNPGDWYPARRDFLPRPWSAPIKDPLPVLVDAFHFFGKNVNRLANGTTLFRQGDYTRNPMDNSQVGVRFSAVTGPGLPIVPEGLQFTLNYFYQRWSGDDGTNAAAFKASSLKIKEVNAEINRGELPIEAIAPYVNTVGASLNYAEEEYTQTVYRMESIYEFGVPFTDSSKPSPHLLLARDVFGISKRDMWKGMLAFDRPTWIRLVNRKATVLILGQFFWHYLLDNPNILMCAQNRSAPACRDQSRQQFKGFRGEFSTSGPPANKGAFVDKVRDWEALVTLAATTFYRGGKIVPFLIYVLDPVNDYNMEVIWMFDYFLTNNLILNLSQRYFINTVNHPVFESWGVAGVNRGRSETGLRLTYQF